MTGLVPPAAVVRRPAFTASWPPTALCRVCLVRTSGNRRDRSFWGARHGLLTSDAGFAWGCQSQEGLCPLCFMILWAEITFCHCSRAHAVPL